ncbi:hypothetical protein QVD17_19893 [Tagetes erecta]|uniref:LysM domain-containing protein n=1 Tax=Tagetes erecta TaxID=13708 RepID=A0AAD8NXQ0_TARER|nr:hypothetical protein QVD17_19893 [Tagetes erecta]
MASLFVKMAAILSVYLMFIALAESRSTLSGFKNSVVTCNQVIGAQSGDDCTSISKSVRLGLESFLAINPNINCVSIFVGQWVCVDGTVTN